MQLRLLTNQVGDAFRRQPPLDREIAVSALSKNRRKMMNKNRKNADKMNCDNVK